MNEAFVYMWLNLDNKKRYIGYHKGDEDDGYLNSAGKEFWKDYHNDPSKFKRRVIARGDTISMEALEEQILNRVDAKNNSSYYNKSNGGFLTMEQRSKIVDWELVEETCKNAVSRTPIIRNTLEVFELERFQTREAKVDSGKVDLIKEYMLASGLEQVNPIVIVKGVEGNDLLLDGNHTVTAAKRAKLPEIPTVELEYEELGSKKANLIAAGNELNARDPDRPTKFAPTKEAIKHSLKQFYLDGVSITDKSFKANFSKKHGYSTISMGLLVSSVLKAIKEEEEIKSTTFRVWEKDELQVKVLEYSNKYPNAIVEYSATTMEGRKLFTMLSEIATIESKDSGILILYSSKPTYEKSFDLRKLEKTIEAYDLPIRVVLLPTI